MRIDGIGNQPLAARPAALPETPKTDKTFQETITKSVGEVNELQAEADQIANGLAAGDAVEIHQAMIAMQKASTALQFTIQVRNKIIEAYQEIMRMQV